MPVIVCLSSLLSIMGVPSPVMPFMERLSSMGQRATIYGHWSGYKVVRRDHQAPLVYTLKILPLVLNW
ncbi:hypothetical protein CesoFtcFv8_017526 [Champsocephalus esox]|uniref:Uncharacterized protein n=1 Tax=Champsocephalus esox TaxID=159716 RepID=A0AAN8BKG8_9TELE|nr:hypothetical protein CesoFtcFv8_017526 [Champsocephalus esox]